MTSTQTTATGAIPAARLAPDAGSAAALPGTPFPLGATPGKQASVAGTNFAIASAVADSVTLCLGRVPRAGDTVPVGLGVHQRYWVLRSARRIGAGVAGGEIAECGLYSPGR